MGEEIKKNSYKKLDVPEYPAILLKAFRELKGYNQEELSAKLEESRSKLKHYENRNASISEKTAFKLQELTGINALWWRTGKGYMFTPKDSLKLRKKPIANPIDIYNRYFTDWLFYLSKINKKKPHEMAEILHRSEHTYNLLTTGDIKAQWEDFILLHSYFEIPLDYFARNPEIYARQIISEHDNKTLIDGVNIDIILDMINENY